MAKSQFTNRQKNISRVIRDRRDRQRAKITAPKIESAARQRQKENRNARDPQ